MALNAEDKAVVDKAVQKLNELKQQIAESNLMRSTGASHIHNELLPIIGELEKLEAE